MERKTHIKPGQPTAYGFACGYIQKAETETLSKELYMEHGTYHVRSTRHNSPQLNTKFDGSVSHTFKIWETFYKAAEARRFYNKIK